MAWTTQGEYGMAACDLALSATIHSVILQFGPYMWTRRAVWMTRHLS